MSFNLSWDIKSGYSMLPFFQSSKLLAIGKPAIRKETNAFGLAGTLTADISSNSAPIILLESLGSLAKGINPTDKSLRKQSLNFLYMAAANSSAISNTGRKVNFLPYSFKLVTLPIGGLCSPKPAL